MPGPQSIDPNDYPHVWYIDIVVGLLRSLGVDPDEWWLSNSDTGHDGAVLTLSAMLVWDRPTAAFVHGVTVFWDREDGWEYAALNENGSNQPVQSLPVPLWAEPVAVTCAIGALLDGRDLPEPTGEWDNALVRSTVERWTP